jgi:hypothetical protein
MRLKAVIPGVNHPIFLGTRLFLHWAFWVSLVSLGFFVFLRQTTINSELIRILAMYDGILLISVILYTLYATVQEIVRFVKTKTIDMVPPILLIIQIAGIGLAVVLKGA